MRRTGIVASAVVLVASLGLYLAWPKLRVAFSQSAPTINGLLYASYRFNALQNPTGLFFGSCPASTSSCIYIADSNNHVVRMFNTSAGTLSVFAGTAGQPGYADGTTASALFQHPTGFVGASNRGFNPFTGRFYSYVYLYVSDGTNYVLRRICKGILFSGSACDNVTTVAGNHTQGFVDGSSLSAAFATLGGAAPPAGAQSALAPPFYICDS